jgi:MATE family multidrug resistance protein
VELGRLLRLAGPVIVAELGWMSMGAVDTVMVGPLGPSAIGAVGLGSHLFFALAVFGMGLLLGLDTLVSQSHGAGRDDECRAWLRHGVALAILLVPILLVLVVVGLRALPLLRLHPEVLALARPYLDIVAWSLVPLLLYAACRRYLQGIGQVRPVMVALVSANLVNAAANWVFIYGHLGMPALGAVGAAWATVASRAYLVLFLAFAIWRHHASHPLAGAAPAWRVEPHRVARLVVLGLPAAVQITLEVGIFTAATAMAGSLSPAALAAHQVALNVAGLVFMVPLGLSSASAVLVGHAVGGRDPHRAVRVGWLALGTISVFMLAVAVVFVSVPRFLLAVFTRDAEVLAVGASLLLVAALFQLFDGLQGVATGVLRGVGDTRTPMAWNLTGHWALGLPTGYLLCFPLGFGVVGLWVGLSVGLTLIGVVLVAIWARRVRALRAGALHALVDSPGVSPG